MQVSKNAIVYILIFAAIVAIAQSPASVSPLQSPCPNVEERAASMAESRLAAERLKIATSEEVQNQLKIEIGRKDVQLASAHQQVGKEQATNEQLAGNVKSLTSTIDSLGSEKTSLQSQLTSVTAERDKLKSKIDAANGRAFCKLLHIGCIGER